MKAKEVLEKLNITRPTLTKYVKEGLIKIDSEVNGQYNYNEDSVNKLLGISNEGTQQVKISEMDTMKKIIDLLIDINYSLAGMHLLNETALNKLIKANELYKSIK